MSIEVTYKDLSNVAFKSGLNKILSAETKDFKVAYHIGRVGDFLEQHHKEAKRTFEKLAKSHGLESDTVLDDSKREAWDKASDEFLAHSVKVERHKIRIDDIKDISLTPLEITALEPILDGLDGLAN